MTKTDLREDRPVRIANFSGFYGDRANALKEVVTDGDVDIVTADYLAEVTMLILAKAQQRDPSAGYAKTFLAHLESALEPITRKRIRVVVNAGGLNPKGLAEEIRALLAKHGSDLSVATVDGDNLTSQLSALQDAGHELNELHSGAPLQAWDFEPLTANAYLGGAGVALALERGADIVITGRTADASIVSGAAMWWWRWERDDYDQLAGAIAAGHVIECGTQATGGNFAGFTEIPGLEYPGFPIAEIARDGTSVITKHAGTGGAVTVDTVTAQLLYEVAAPQYLNSDVVTHLDTIRLDQDGPDRVRISGVVGSAPPATTKVAITAIGGWRNSGTFLITGRNVEEKLDLIRRTVEKKVASLDNIRDLTFAHIGAGDPSSDTQWGQTSLYKVTVRGDKESAGRAFSSLLVEMALASYPGHYQLSPPSNGSSYGEYWPALILQDALKHRVTLPDGEQVVISPPEVYADPEANEPVSGAGSASEQAQGVVPLSDRTVALGEFAFARSGDKGGDANVGVWVRDESLWPWLRAVLTVDRVKELLPETEPLSVERHELPNLNAVNFYLRGMLDEGAAATSRLDNQAKALGEWLLARPVPAPTE